MRIFFLIFLISTHIFAENPCTIFTENTLRTNSSNDHKTNLSYLWRNPTHRETIYRFLKYGILKEDPSLAELVFKKMDELIQITPPLSDQEIFRKIKTFIEDQSSHFMDMVNRDEAARRARRVGHVQFLVDSPSEIYVDIGAGDGKIASGLAMMWGLKKDQVFALEVGEYPKMSPNVTWLDYTENFDIPLPSNSLDLSSLLMALHHINDVGPIIFEIHRILKVGGQLLIRETDASDVDTAILSEVLDKMFYVVFSNSREVPLPNNYKSASDWKSIIELYGFKMRKYEDIDENNPFSPFYMIFEKE